MKTATVTRQKVWGGIGFRYCKTVYTVTIPGEPFTFSGSGWGWVKFLCKRYGVSTITKQF